MLAYLDASAIVKLVRREPESDVLFAFLADWPERVTNIVATVEVPRAIRRASKSARHRELAESVMARLGLVELDTSICSLAATLLPVGLRSLDAIHLASALVLGGDVGTFVTYDHRLVDAARKTRVNVSSPE